MSKKKETGGVDFNGLSRHGYCSGPSVMTILPQESNWSWSNGRDRDDKEVALESYEECECTRVAVTGEKFIGEQNAQPNSLLSERQKSESFSQKEKQKRDRCRPAGGRTTWRRRSVSLGGVACTLSLILDT
jgi:hypothetical protein